MLVTLTIKRDRTRKAQGLVAWPAHLHAHAGAVAGSGSPNIYEKKKLPWAAWLIAWIGLCTWIRNTRYIWTETITIFYFKFLLENGDEIKNADRENRNGNVEKPETDHFSRKHVNSGREPIIQIGNNKDLSGHKQLEYRRSCNEFKKHEVRQQSMHIFSEPLTRCTYF